MASVCSGLPCITSTAPAPAPGTFCPMKTHAHCAFSNSSLTFAVVVSTVFFRFPPLGFLGSSRVNGGDPPHGKQARKRSIALGQCCTTHDAYQRPPAATPFSVVLPRLASPFLVPRAETSADRSFRGDRSVAPVPCSTFHVSATEAHWAAFGAASPLELPAEGDTHVWSSFSTCAGDACGHHIRIWNGLPDDCKLRRARLRVHLFNARVWGKRARHIEKLLPLELIEHVGGELLPICGDTHLPCCDGHRRHRRWATRG